MNALKAVALAGSVVIGLGALEASARDLRLAPGMLPLNDLYESYNIFARLLPEATGGELTASLIGTEVVNLGNALESVRIGIIDGGQVLLAYTPAEFPNSLFVGDFGVFGANGQVAIAAATEYILNCSECLAEFQRLGVIYTGHVATPPYHILSSRPVEHLADLQGMRLRSGSPANARWISAMGGVPVQMSVNDQLEAISNGLLGGTLNPDSSLEGWQLGEVVGYVTGLSTGTYQAGVPFALRAQTWADLTPDQRREVVRAAVMGTANYNPLTVAVGERAVEEYTASHGLRYIQPAQDLLDAHAAFLETEIQTIAELGRTQYGIQDADERIAYFLSLVEKWTAYFDEHGYDAETVGNAIFDQIWAEVDFSTYGL